MLSLSCTLANKFSAEVAVKAAAVGAEGDSSEEAQAENCDSKQE